MSDDTTDQTDRSRDELYDLAREQDVPGRSTMTKQELADAVATDGGAADGGAADGYTDADEAQPAYERGGGGPRVASRLETFSALAQARAKGEFVMLPRLLRGDDRRLHVRQTLREDHQTRIANGADDAAAKFEKLAGSVFSFFRGTALLFYRDLAGEDSWMPTVLTLGDVHPENFGVMPSADNVPIFGVNDFDEAYYAPFTWDLKRGAVGFMIAAGEEGGHGRKKQRKIAKKFVEGYIDGMARFAEEGTESDHQLRLDNSPEIVQEIISDNLEERAEWLADDHLDEHKRGFRSDDELVPCTSRREEFQELLNRYVEVNGIEVPARAGKLRVKDVAERKGAGTASLGLPRYYVMIEGPEADGTDDLIIEFKQARRSALSGLVPPSDIRYEGMGERIAHAQHVQLVRGDIFYGHMDFEGLSFMVRERAPFRGDVDLDDLSKSEWKEYAHVCGAVLAHAHALSDETGDVDRDIEPVILDAIGDQKLFVDDIVRFADEAAERLRRDHEAFVADYELGAFHSIDMMYR